MSLGAASRSAAIALAGFGLIHAYELTPAGVQNKIGWGAAGTYALAYLCISVILLILHYAHRHRDVGKRETMFVGLER